MRALQAYEDAVRAVPEPEFTDTWHPVSHARVLDALEREVETLEMDVVSRDYTLTKSGNRMFGVWRLDGGRSGAQFALGIRNAIDKSLAWGLCAGTNVTVCSNLMFDGEFIRFRKHTGGLDEDELRYIAQDALWKARTLLQDLLSWHVGLRHVWVGKQGYKVLTYNALKAGAVTPSKFNDFVTCLELEVEREGNHNLYAWHGAVTRLMRNESFFNIARKSKALKKVTDKHLEEVRQSKIADHVSRMWG
jgi:hypothetical protein